jgi:hypothetical protein
MKKKLLFFIVGALVSFGAFAQTIPVPIINYSFSEPAYAGKISNWSGITGWIHDGIAADAGRETKTNGARNTTDSLVCYFSNGDKGFYQVLSDTIPTSSVIYKLSYVARTDNGGGAIRTYLGAKNGGAITFLDSIDNTTNGTWTVYHETYTLPLNSVKAGDSLVIYVKATTNTWGNWVLFDSVSLTKQVLISPVSIINYSFSEPAYTGKISNWAGITGWPEISEWENPTGVISRYGLVQFIN